MLGFLTGYFEDRVILDVMDVLGRPQGSYPESCVDIFIGSVSRMGGPLCGYLEDVEGFLQKMFTG